MMLSQNLSESRGRNIKVSRPANVILISRNAFIQKSINRPQKIVQHLKFHLQSDLEGKECLWFQLCGYFDSLESLDFDDTGFMKMNGKLTS